MNLSDKFAWYLNTLKYNLSDVKAARNLFVAITFTKLIVFIFITNTNYWFFREATDANLYDSMARGEYVWPHPWGDFLKNLNSLGLYSRSSMAAIIFFMHCTLVPWLLAHICFGKQRLNAVNWYMLSFMVAYPTMFIFSTDVFRDTPMVILFLLYVYGMTYFLNRSVGELSFWLGIFYLLAMVISGYLLYKLRFYLALAMFVSIVLAYVLDLKRLWWLYAVLYFLVLFVADYFGVFDYLKGSYRLEYADAGSAYGIDYSKGFFLLNYAESFVYNVFGFFVYDKMSSLVFLLESIPLTFLAIYVYINRKYSSRCVGFFVCFFFVYAAFWVVGTDALGTAVRYRIFNYLSLAIAASLVYQSVEGCRKAY